MLEGLWTFIFLISAVTEETKDVKLGFILREGNLSYLSFYFFNRGRGVSTDTCSCKRVSISIVSIRSDESCSSNKDNSSSRSLSCCVDGMLSLSVVLEYILLNSSFLANRFKSLIISKVSRLKAGQKLNPLDNNALSSAESLWLERLMIFISLMSIDRACTFPMFWESMLCPVEKTYFFLLLRLRSWPYPYYIERVVHPCVERELLPGVPKGQTETSPCVLQLPNIPEPGRAEEGGWFVINFLCALESSSDNGRFDFFCLFLLRLRDEEETETDEKIEESDHLSSIDFVMPLFLGLEG